MKTLILGRGKSGESAAELARRDGAAVESIEGFDLVIASPGIRVMSELEYGVRKCRERGIKLLAVTGSKGKSSVVKLVSDALQLAGFRAVPCGNYGKPVSEVARETAVDWAVVEVSSFQLETTNLPPDAFEAAAILNLQEDHLDRHGSLAVYHGLKRKLLGMARRTVGNVDAPAVAGAGDGENLRSLLKGSYFDNDILRENGGIAIGLLRAAGVGDAVIARAFLEFVPLPHRMNLVGIFGGVRCLDDSKATSVAALGAGVTMAGGKVRLIAGGLGKNDDPQKIITPLTNGVKKVYLIGNCAELFFAAWSGVVECELCGNLETAVRNAMRDAVEGETILLSPGAASFDQFKNFGERGDRFAELVQQEGKKKDE